MKHQRDIRRFPTEKPPDLESENPGAVGTATGAEFQSVLLRTTLNYRKPDPSVQANAHLGIERSVFPQRVNSHGRRPCNPQQSRPLIITGGASAKRGAVS